MLYNVQAGVLATWSWHLTESSVQVMTRWPVSVLLQALQDPLLVEYQEWGARTTFCRLHFRLQWLQAWSGKIAQCRSQFWLLASLRFFFAWTQISRLDVPSSGQQQPTSHLSHLFVAMTDSHKTNRYCKYLSVSVSEESEEPLGASHTAAMLEDLCTLHSRHHAHDRL